MEATEQQYIDASGLFMGLGLHLELFEAGMLAFGFGSGFPHCPVTGISVLFAPFAVLCSFMGCFPNS